MSLKYSSCVGVRTFLTGALLTTVLLVAYGGGARADTPPCGRDAVPFTPTTRDVQRAARRTVYVARPSKGSLFRDPDDGHLDASAWMEQSTGFLPVPIIITEPAVGFGLGLAPVFVHGKPRRMKRADGTEGRVVPPSVTAAGGAATLNGTWFVFAGHLGVWKDDRIRYTGGAGYASVNIDVYGVASEAAGRPLAINLKGTFLLQDLAFRLGESNWFVGGRYVFFSSDVGLGERPSLPGLDARALDSKLGGLGVSLTYDSRDNMFSPNSGIRAQALGTLFDESFGSDFAYRQLHVYGLMWKQIAKKWNLGLRLDGQAVDGDVPFYALPFVQLRGVPAMRYQGNDVVTAETQVRYDLTSRWSLGVFGGYGRAARSFGSILDDKLVRGTVDEAWSVGTGFRYTIAKRLGLRIGIDIARSADDWTFYIITGNPWLRP